MKLLEAPPVQGAVERVDPLEAVRAKLTAAGNALALQRDEDPFEWSVYVERHIAGVRFMLRDAHGREVDLQKVPGTMEELCQPPR